MQAESGQLPTFTERLNSSSPAYSSSPSITAFLNSSRVCLLKKNPQTQLPQRVSSSSTGVLLPSSDQPPGTPRAPCSEYTSSDKNLRKTTRRHTPKMTKSRKLPGCSPALLVEQKSLMEMWTRYPGHRDLMLKARRHLWGNHSISKGNVAFTSLRVGIKPGSHRAAEIVVLRSRWERVRRKMEILRRRWGLRLVTGDVGETLSPPAVVPGKAIKVAKGFEGLEDIAEAEDEGDENGVMENVLLSIEVDE